MAQNPQDAAPKRPKTKRPAGGADAEPISAAQAIAFLRRNPKFLCENQDLLEVLKTPGQNSGNGIADLQLFRVEKLRRDLAELTGAHDALVVTARGNLAAQTRTHKAILALLKARNFEHFIETLTTDMAVILDLDVIVVGVEQAEDGTASPPAAGVVALGPKTVDRQIGPGQNIVLRGHVTGDPEIFGPGAGLVHSEALIRLSFGRAAPSALLAFGARDALHFEAGQGTELLCFLARVVETSIRGWLDLPE